MPQSHLPSPNHIYSIPPLLLSYFVGSLSHGSFSMFFFFTAQAQDMVVCLSETGCVGTDLGVMTPTECCVQNARGRTYRVPGQEICMECVGECTKFPPKRTLVRPYSLHQAITYHGHWIWADYVNHDQCKEGFWQRPKHLY